MPFTIRRATRKDMPALGQLGALLVRLHHAFDAERFMMPEGNLESGYAHFLETQLRDDTVIVFVAEDDERRRVLGYVYAGLEPQSWKELRDACGYVHDLVVNEADRGHGIAGALMEAASRWLRERGAPRVVLGTAQLNVTAQRLFERLGFRRTMVEMTKEL